MNRLKATQRQLHFCEKNQAFLQANVKNSAIPSKFVQIATLKKSETGLI